MKCLGHGQASHWQGAINFHVGFVIRNSKGNNFLNQNVRGTIAGKKKKKKLSPQRRK